MGGRQRFRGRLQEGGMAAVRGAEEAWRRFGGRQSRASPDAFSIMGCGWQLLNGDNILLRDGIPVSLPGMPFSDCSRFGHVKAWHPNPVPFPSRPDLTFRSISRTLPSSSLSLILPQYNPFSPCRFSPHFWAFNFGTSRIRTNRGNAVLRSVRAHPWCSCLSALWGRDSTSYDHV